MEAEGAWASLTRDGGQHIKNLHHRAQRHDPCDNRDDLLVLGEEVRELIPQAPEKSQVEYAEDTANEEHLLRISRWPRDSRGCGGLTTWADVLAALTSFAPIRFAIRVEAAIDTGNGIMNIVPDTVTRMDCAAR